MGKHSTNVSLSPGQVVGGCRIEKLIGRGGMGEVYLAEHVHLRKPVAVKVLPLGDNRSELVKRFLFEARAGARIEHPNVVTIHDVGQQADIYYIVMQYVEGTDLASLLKQQAGPLPWQAAVKVTRMAAKGLHAIHEQGLIHRDIKPSNIMLAKDGRVLLMDFGLVRSEAGSDLTRTGLVVGTVPFMSPEQCQGQPLDRRSDIFSLGCTLYTLLTNERPYQGTNEQVVLQIAGGKSPPPVEKLNPSVPGEVSQIVAKAMAYRPARRYENAQEVARALGNLLRQCRPDAGTADTLSLDSVQAETQTIPELELVPSESVEIEPVTLLVYTPWLIAGAVFIGLLLVALALNFFLRKPVPEGMICIDAGYVHSSNDEGTIRTHLASVLTETELDSLVKLIAEEANSRTYVRAFQIDAHEVTNSQYHQFVLATHHRVPSHWENGRPPPGQENHPVVYVGYADAEAYARWAGKELPTREQWMRAFRGDSDQLFPWGNQYRPGLANDAGNSFGSTSPVDATPADRSPFGVFNLVGNVSELLRGQTVYQSQNCRVAKGAEFCMRGEVYGLGLMSFYYADGREKDKGVGFRCVIEKR